MTFLQKFTPTEVSSYIYGNTVTTRLFIGTYLYVLAISTYMHANRVHRDDFSFNDVCTTIAIEKTSKSLKWS